MESRFLHGSSLESLKLSTEYKLIKTITDSLIEYDYESVSDSTRNFEISYKLQTKTLFLDLDRFKMSDKNVLQDEEFPELWFDNYRTIKPIIDGMGPIMFNSEYGILAITGPLGPTHLFLTKKSDTILSKKILDKLN